MSTIGKNIKQLRIQKKWKQSEFAKRTAISCSYLSEIETGKALPSITMLNKIASCLGVSCASLLDETIDKEIDPDENSAKRLL